MVAWPSSYGKPSCHWSQAARSLPQVASLPLALSAFPARQDSLLARFPHHGSSAALSHSLAPSAGLSPPAQAALMSSSVPPQDPGLFTPSPAGTFFHHRAPGSSVHHFANDSIAVSVLPPRLSGAWSTARIVAAAARVSFKSIFNQGGAPPPRSPSHACPPSYAFSHSVVCCGLAAQQAPCDATASLATPQAMLFRGVRPPAVDTTTPVLRELLAIWPCTASDDRPSRRHLTASSPQDMHPSPSSSQHC